LQQTKGYFFLAFAAYPGDNALMETLASWVDNFLLVKAHSGPTVFTVIGSGGKTTLIWHLAALFAKAGFKVLVSPTTKMFPQPDIPPGVTLEGRFNEKSGKLEALPLAELERFIADYDFVLLEGDGANGLPLKAWADHEPVVPDFTIFTIGVLPIWPLGKPLSPNIVHRLPLFIELTGAAPGGAITHEHFLSIITGQSAPRRNGDEFTYNSKIKQSLFAKARGKKILFWSQVNDAQAVKLAEEIVGLLPVNFRAGLSGIIYGDVALL